MLAQGMRETYQPGAHEAPEMAKEHVEHRHNREHRDNYKGMALPQHKQDQETAPDQQCYSDPYVEEPHLREIQPDRPPQRPHHPTSLSVPPHGCALPQFNRPQRATDTAHSAQPSIPTPPTRTLLQRMQFSTFPFHRTAPLCRKQKTRPQRDTEVPVIPTGDLQCLTRNIFQAHSRIARSLHSLRLSRLPHHTTPPLT
jgi:hypothetical protein